VCVCVHKYICVYRHSTHTHTHAHTNIDNLLLLDVHRDLLDDLLFAAPLLVLDLCVCVCVCVCVFVCVMMIFFSRLLSWYLIYTHSVSVPGLGVWEYSQGFRVRESHCPEPCFGT
jgi:hypothetical protein